MTRYRLTVVFHFLVALLTAVCMERAQAARPFVTDDARTVDHGHCQLETFTKSQRAYAGSEDWFLPACNPFGVELTLGWNRIEEDRNTILQGKFLLKELKTNGVGFAASAGSFGGEPFLNGIASFSFFDDRSVIHTNLGAIRSDIGRLTWGVGLEQLLIAPRVYGILEAYGQTADKPTLHMGLRFWVLPNRLQIDSTIGRQGSSPEQRFFTVGLRALF
jgi:hypothetical protein